MSVSSKAIVNNNKGIHARPSSEIAREALKYQSEIIITYNDKNANAKDVLQLIMLELFQGTTVEIEASGPDEKEALEGTKKFIEKVYEYD